MEIAHTIFVIIPKCVRERACFYYHWLCARGYLHTQSNTKHTNTRTHKQLTQRYDIRNKNVTHVCASLCWFAALKNATTLSASVTRILFSHPHTRFYSIPHKVPARQGTARRPLPPQVDQIYSVTTDAVYTGDTHRVIV